MSRTVRPLRGRVVLVLGAGGRTARAAALRLAAQGAAVVAAGPALDEVLTTAGLIAAAGGVVRVIEPSAPPLLGAELVEAATAALERPTDAVVSPGSFPSPADAEEAAEGLRPELPRGAVVTIVDAKAPLAPETDRVEALFLASARPGPATSG